MFLHDYMKRFCFKVFFALATLCCCYLYAAPHNGDSFYLKQPDGSKVGVLVYGDEWYQRVSGIDGYTLVRDNRQWICYAKLSHDGNELLPTEIVYTDGTSRATASRLQALGIVQGIDIKPEAQLAQRMSKIQTLSSHSRYSRSMPQRNGNSSLPRNVRGLTICIDFADQPFSLPVSKIDSLANGTNYVEYGNNGSVYEYFKDVSEGKLLYNNFVLGYIRAPKLKSYYDDTSAAGDKARELVKWAVRKVRDSLNFDLSQLTANQSNFIYALNIFYAGFPESGWSKGLWPHSWNLDTAIEGNGKKVLDYQMTNIGTELSIGTFVHENCHMVLSIPDLYSYLGTSRGVGRYCVMCANDKKNPQRISAPFRGWLGWLDTINVTHVTTPNTYVLPANSNQAILYKNKKDTCEYFLVENIARKGRNTTMLDFGLMIWHVDTNKQRTGGAISGLPWGNHWNQMKPDSHYLVSVEQANNQFKLERNIGFGGAGDLYSSRVSNRFNDNTLPSSHFWNDSASGLAINSISCIGDTMSFILGELPLSLTTPAANDTLYCESTTQVTWRSFATVKRINLDISYDLGMNFTSIVKNFDNALSYKWVVPSTTSESCIMRITASDSTALTYRSRRFIIKHGFSTLSANPSGLDLSVSKGMNKDISVTIKNEGKAQVQYKVESRNQCTQAMINEIYMGSIQKYPMNGVEIYNKGGDLDISGWKLQWVDNAGTSTVYTFADGSMIKAGKTIVATKDRGVPNDSNFFIGQSVYWRAATLKLAIALITKGGLCVDYVKIGDTSLTSLKGCSWEGPGIALNANFFKKDLVLLSRKGTVNHFAASDWNHDTLGGTANSLNPGQENSANQRPWISLEQTSGNLDAVTMKNVLIHLLTLPLDNGLYLDTLYVSHTAVNTASPLLLPCRIQVGPVGIKPQIMKNSSALLVHPQPALHGGRESITISLKQAYSQAYLMIFDAVGNCLLASSFQGKYVWNMKDYKGNLVPSGAYLCVLKTVQRDGTEVLHEKMIGIGQ